MPRTSSPDGLGELLARQSSVVSRGQLLTLGMKDSAMQYRVRRGGPWQALLPGVYLAASGVPSLSQKEMAALLYAGPGSLITCPTALLHRTARMPARGRCTVSQLAEELRTGPVRGSATLRSVLAEVADGIRSTA